MTRYEIYIETADGSEFELIGRSQYLSDAITKVSVYKKFPNRDNKFTMLKVKDSNFCSQVVYEERMVK